MNDSYRATRPSDEGACPNVPNLVRYQLWDCMFASFKLSAMMVVNNKEHANYIDFLTRGSLYDA